MEQLPIAGTFEPNALILSNRTDQDLSSLHSFGIHCIPHIGVYGENYSVALPMILLSIQPTLSVLNQIPSDPLSALDINLQLLYESSLRRIARDIATRVLKSAFKYVNNFASWRNRNENNGKESEGVEDVECIPSIIPSDCVDITSNVSLLLPNDSEDIENDITDMNEEQFLRKVAQKLVRKIIHSACTRLEPLSRVDSIEELVTDTKRLRLTFSPSYTPPLQPEEIKESTGQPQLAVNRAGNVVNNRLSPNSGVFSIGSQAGLQECKNNRKKRQRSASHEANMEKDMEKIRLKFQTNVQISDGQESVKTSSAEATSTVLLTSQQRSVTNIVSDIRKMSIMEVEEQENVTHNEEEDDDYTVLEAVTKPMISPLPDLKITDFSSNRLKDTKISLENLPTQNFPSHNYTSSPIPHIYPQSSTIDDLDYYIVIHSYPPSSQCQKFLCSNDDEVNVMFHCWLYKDIPYDPTISVTEQMNMGIFEPEGISPVHLDLVDSGISFFYMEPRTVCIHDSCFSPENAMLQLSLTSNNFRSFFSVGSHLNRRVITFHVLPSSKSIEGQMSEILQECDGNLLKFTEIISSNFPDLGKILNHLMKPILF